MVERLVPILKGACGLALLVAVLQLIGLRHFRDPLSDFQMPKLPSATAPDRSDAVETPGGPTNRPGSKPPRQRADLPAPVRDRIDRVVRSGMFGPPPRTVPIALLGVAGDEAFLRVTNGATGRLGVGETLGGVTVLRITTNRVLIEHGGETNELTLFSGMGSDSLLPASKPSTKRDSP